MICTGCGDWDEGPDPICSYCADELRAEIKRLQLELKKKRRRVVQRNQMGKAMPWLTKVAAARLRIVKATFRPGDMRLTGREAKLLIIDDAVKAERQAYLSALPRWVYDPGKPEGDGSCLARMDEHGNMERVPMDTFEVPPDAIPAPRADGTWTSMFQCKPYPAEPEQCHCGKPSIGAEVDAAGCRKPFCQDHDPTMPDYL